MQIGMHCFLSQLNYLLCTGVKHLCEAEARKCRFCGYEFVPGSKAPKEGGRPRRLVLLVLFAVLLIFMLLKCSASEPNPEAPAAKDPDREQKNATIQSYLNETGQLPNCRVGGTHYLATKGALSFYCLNNSRRYLVREDNWGRYQLEAYD